MSFEEKKTSIYGRIVFKFKEKVKYSSNTSSLKNKCKNLNLNSIIKFLKTGLDEQKINIQKY